MKSQAANARLSADKKAALLDAMRKAPASEQPGGKQAAPASRRVQTYDTSFETLPGFQMMKTQRAIGDALGLSNPFYRQHDAKAGARSVIDGKPVLNFASYDYLGLNGHPEIVEAVSRAAKDWGTSVSASRITAGERPVHRELERALADLYETEDCLTFVGGHSTAVTTIAALTGPQDLILHDSLIHNCIVVGGQLSGATRRIFPHNDLDALEAMLETSRDKFQRVLILVEGLYSMDGDGPDLARLVDIKERWGCWLLMDEAHAIGVLGKTGRGIFEMAGVDPARVDIWFGTLSKTLVSCGGYIAGKRALVEFLKFAAAGMVYSVGMPAGAAIASTKALELMRREPERVTRLQENGKLFLDLARQAGLDVGTSWGYAVTPVIIGDSLRTVLLSENLLKRGINAFPIIPPGVPEKSARLRFFISASHSREDIAEAVRATREELTLLEDRGLTAATAHLLLKA